MTCVSCSVELPAGAGFCPACGAAVGASAAATRTRVAGDPRSMPIESFATPVDRGRFQAGDVVAERYRIVGLLGRGGMGEVYRADDLKLGRTVALKFLPETMENDPARLVRLFNEVRTALRVTHPNVCRVYDIGETAGRHFLSMEYVDGEDMATLLRRIGRLPADRAVRVARQLCAGLAAAHAQGVLHRDLKPANVMLDGRGEVKITDFGLAGAVGEFAGDEIRVGTPAYMAPEQAEGREVTVRSDLYGLGLVLYELFSGAPALDARTPRDLDEQRRSGPTSLSSRVDGLDPAVARVVDRCLAADPVDRPASAAAIAAALPGGDPLAAALAAGETPSPELVAEAGASAGLRPARAIALLLTVVALLAATAALGARTILVSRARLDLSSAVLANKAAELIRAVGWGAETRDRVDTWIPDWSLYQHIRTGEAAAHRWDTFGTPWRPALWFAYRESPDELVQLSPGAIGNWMSDPPPTRPGMVEVRLAPDGRLVSFAAVPAPFGTGSDDTAGAAAGPGDPFAPLFEAADLDRATLDEVEPTLRPQEFADRRVAWTGRSPADGGTDIRVEAASLAGRPVSFRVLQPWDRPFTERPAPPTFWARMASLVGSIWFAAVVLGATIVAIRNVRLNRGDHRTALRFGLYLAAVRLMWLSVAHHHTGSAEIDLIRGHMAWSAYRFVLAYVFYLALEPYARRLWPEMLVSWVRIFGGRLRDARVGRDLLIGAAAGCAFGLILGLTDWVPQVIGLRDYGLTTAQWSWESLGGIGPALGALAGLHVTSVLDNFNGVMMFLVLRVVTRRTWIAVAGVSALGVVIFNPGVGSPWPYVIGVVLGMTLFWIVLFRAGLLSVMVMLSVADTLNAIRVTPELTAWHAQPMWLAYGAVAVVAVWGFRVAIAGRPLFRDEIQAAWARGGA